VRISVLLLALAAAAAGAQPRVEFEVASIHASSAEEGSSSWSTAQGSLRMVNFSLRRMIMTAYQISDAQLTGGPKWIDSARFDLLAKPPEASTNPQLLAMLQTLLADRFKLELHHERKEIPGYSLVVSRGGLKVPRVEEGKSQTGIGNARIEAKATGCDKLAELLARVLGAPVTNNTNVEGAYDFTIEWSPDGKDTTGPSLFTALQEKLGLKLESRKVMNDVIVVESADKPSEN
jgi:uncharacterized protein (TIGR03435 family)